MPPAPPQGPPVQPARRPLPARLARAWTAGGQTPAAGRVLTRLLAAAALAGTVWLIAASGPYAVLRERAFDTLLANVRPPGSGTAPSPMPPVVVVDIDRPSLSASDADAVTADPGGWPWSRQQLARLVARIAAARPRAIGLDMLLAEPDRRSPAALARALAAVTTDAALAERARTLPDGDRALAAALANAPSVLGAALDPEAHAPPPRETPILVAAPTPLSGIWSAAGAIAPPQPLLDTVAGLGALVIDADADGRIRRVPLLTLAAGRPMPGLAVETARLAQEASALILGQPARHLAVGAHALPLGPDATLRLRPRARSADAARTLPAAAVLESDAALARLAGAVVLVGSSAPEAGGLRHGGDGELVASVQLQADAVSQILAGDAPHRPAALTWIEYAVGLLAALLAGLAGWRLAPARGALVPLAVLLLWPAASALAHGTRNLLVDPVLPVALAVAAFALAALANAARTWAREARLRARFAQHVSPEVVARLVAEPNLARLEGELRTVTVLVTDIEGFTGLVERAEPRALVALLDRYLDTLTSLVIAHGGMVNKIVGDSVIALFNAPLDLERHEERALACALAMADAAARLRREPEASALHLGRTRIGIETGPLIVGDVGGAAKIDYTGYGDALNTAARLEAANKELGSTILVGATAAAGMAAHALRPIAQLTPRGRSQVMTVHEPWPDDWTETDRAAWREAFAASRTSADAARARFADLAARHAGDATLARLARLPRGID